MNKWYKNVLVGLIIFVAIIGVPIGINELYKYGLTIDSPYITMWSASNVLSFYGDVLGALMTIVAIIMTIRYTTQQNIKAYEKERLIKNNNEKIKYLEDIKNLFLLEELNVEMNDWRYKIKYDYNIEKFFHNVIKNEEIREKNFYNTIKNEEIDEIQFMIMKKFNEQLGQFLSFAIMRITGYYVHVKEIELKNIEYKEPMSCSKLTSSLINDLKYYRDRHKDEFLESYENMLEINKNNFNKQIKKYM